MNKDLLPVGFRVNQPDNSELFIIYSLYYFLVLSSFKKITFLF